MSLDVNGYMTHHPVTVACALAAKGPVVECGSGHYSTALLHTICKMKNLDLRSFDEDPAWADLMNAAYDGEHTIEQVDDIAQAVRDMPVVPDFLFIDNGCYKIAALWERRRVLEVARDLNVRLIVCHDTEPKNRFKYQFDKAFPWFKYRVDFRGTCFRLCEDFPHRPWTTALSNTDDLEWLREALPEAIVNA